MAENLYFWDSPFYREMDFSQCPLQQEPEWLWDRHPCSIQTSAEHGPEQPHIIGPAQSRELDLCFSEQTYIILYSAM